MTNTDKTLHPYRKLKLLMALQNGSNQALPTEAEKTLQKLSAKIPEAKLEENDDFAIYHGSTRWAERVFDPEAFADKSDEEIIETLSGKERLEYYHDLALDWEAFVPKHPERAKKIILKLPEQTELWQRFFYSRERENQEDYLKAQWKAWFLEDKHQLVEEYCTKDIGSLSSICDWFKAVARHVPMTDEEFVKYWRYFWEKTLSKPDRNDEWTGCLVNAALNHPVGILAETLMHRFYEQKRKTGEGLPKVLLPCFDDITNSNNQDSALAWVSFGLNYKQLYSVDSAWTEAYLLPVFEALSDTEASSKTRCVWQGFLWVSDGFSIYTNIFPRFKVPMLKLLKHWERVIKNEDLRERLIQSLLFARIHAPELLTEEETKKTFEYLTTKDLERLVFRLRRVLANPVAQSKEVTFWKKKLLPFFRDFWPTDKTSNNLSKQLFKLALEGKKAFIPMAQFFLEERPALITKGNFEYSTLFWAILKKDDEDRQCAFLFEDKKAAEWFIKFLEQLTRGLSEEPTYDFTKCLLTLWDKFPTLERLEASKEIKRRFESAFLRY